MGAVCGGEDRPKHKADGAAVQGEDGKYELSADHDTYLKNSEAKTAAKSKEISSAWAAADRSGNDEIQASARFWFEFQNAVAARLEEIKQIGKEAKEGEEAADPKEAHEKFLKEINFTLEESVMRIWKAYSVEDENGDRKIGKEASMRLYDDFINRHESMALHSVQDYTRYLMKNIAQQDSGIQDNKKEFEEKAVKAAVKDAKASALASAMSGKDNIAELEKLIEKAKAAEADTAEAEEKLGKMKEAKAEADKKAEEKKAEADKKAEEAKAKKLESASDAEKEKIEKAAADKKEKEDKAAAAAAEKKEAADKAAVEAVEAKSEADEKAATDKAKEASEGNWLLSLNNAIDGLIADSTKEYEANVLNKQKEGFEKFFAGGNKAGDEYDLARDYLEKVLTVGGGDFEGFVGGLGFTVDEAAALEAIKGKLTPEEEKKEEKKE